MSLLILTCSFTFIMAGLYMIYSAIAERGFREKPHQPPMSKVHWIDAAQVRMKRNADQRYNWRNGDE